MPGYDLLNLAFQVFISHRHLAQQLRTTTKLRNLYDNHCYRWNVRKTGQTFLAMQHRSSTLRN